MQARRNWYMVSRAQTGRERGGTDGSADSQLHIIVLVNANIVISPKRLCVAISERAETIVAGCRTFVSCRMPNFAMSAWSRVRDEGLGPPSWPPTSWSSTLPLVFSGSALLLELIEKIPMMNMSGSSSIEGEEGENKRSAWEQEKYGAFKATSFRPENPGLMCCPDKAGFIGFMLCRTFACRPFRPLPPCRVARALPIVARLQFRLHLVACASNNGLLAHAEIQFGAVMVRVEWRGECRSGVPRLEDRGRAGRELHSTASCGPQHKVALALAFISLRLQRARIPS
jgi:hypothetical protein